MKSAGQMERALCDQPTWLAVTSYCLARCDEANGKKWYDFALMANSIPQLIAQVENPVCLVSSRDLISTSTYFHEVDCPPSTEQLTHAELIEQLNEALDQFLLAAAELFDRQSGEIWNIIINLIALTEVSS